MAIIRFTAALTRWVLPLAASMLVSAGSAWPQAFPDSGHLVRVRTRGPSRTYEARALKIGPDSLVLALPDASHGRVVTIARSSVTRAWVDAGPARKTATGAQAGMIAGAALGALAGFAAYKPCDTHKEWCIAPESALLSALLGTVIGIPVGAAVGATAGALTVGQSWQAVDPGTLLPTGNPPPPRIARGARVQTRLPELRVTGTLLDLTDSALVLRRDGPGDTLSLPFATLPDVRVLQARQPSLRACLIAAGIGAALGGVLGCRSDAEDACPKGITLGATLGLSLGRLVRTDRWVGVPVPVLHWVAVTGNGP